MRVGSEWCLFLLVQMVVEGRCGNRMEDQGACLWIRGEEVLIE